MTDNEMKFLLIQWGQPFLTGVIQDIAANITKNPNDSIILAVAIKHTNRKIDDLNARLNSLLTTVKTLTTSETSGFNFISDVPPSSVPPVPLAPAPDPAAQVPPASTPSST